MVGPENPLWRGGKIQLDCPICGTGFERYPSELNESVTVCRDECRLKWLSGSFLGEGHPNWKGWPTGNYGKGWNRDRKKALARDDYECVLCGKDRETIGRNPDVHHIIPVRFFVESDEYAKEDAHSLDNVVSLCVDCHRKADFGKVSRDELRSGIGVSN